MMDNMNMNNEVVEATETDATISTSDGQATATATRKSSFFTKTRIIAIVAVGIVILLGIFFFLPKTSKSVMPSGARVGMSKKELSELFGEPTYLSELTDASGQWKDVEFLGHKGQFLASFTSEKKDESVYVVWYYEEDLLAFTSEVYQDIQEYLEKELGEPTYTKENFLKGAKMVWELKDGTCITLNESSDTLSDETGIKSILLEQTLLD